MRYLKLLARTVSPYFFSSHATASLDEFISDAHGLLLIGRAGSGKSTLARRLQDRGYIFFSSGDLLRKQIRDNTDVADRLKAVIKKGDVIPDSLILEVIESCIKDRIKKPFIFDNFPLNTTQFEYLYKLLSESDLIKKVKIIFMDVSSEEALKRIGGRLTCTHCSKSYNIHTHAPKVADMCDDCGSDLTIRTNDKREIAEKRMKLFDEDTLPVLEQAQKMSMPIFKVGSDE